MNHRVTGLTTAEAASRLAHLGPNEIVREPPADWVGMLGRQFASPAVWLLIAAAVASAALGERLEAAAIGLILVLNAIVGFLQEFRAERALSALSALTSPQARVVRDGHRVVIAAREVVQGDLIAIEAGDLVAADAHLVEAWALTVNEASLTGESVPVEKTTNPSQSDAPLAERADWIFAGTAVASGSGLADVRAIGMTTELGKIAGLLATVRKAETPLEQRLRKIGQSLVMLCAGIVAVVALIGFLRGWSAFEVFMAGASLAVAAIPEGLPAVVTVALAIGVQRMAARHVLVRRLRAVETLGCVTVICTDKTGTLTTGVMAVRELWGDDHSALLFAAAACCDAELGSSGKNTGDATELAILAAAAERDIERTTIERERPRVHVVPFDVTTRRMSVTRADGITYMKGAPEAVLALAGGFNPDAVSHAYSQMAGNGLRVLAVATRQDPATAFRFLGLIGMADPPRTEAIEAVAAARRAGIATVMITGDHPATAHAIAREFGVERRAGAHGFAEIHARATPEDKLQLVRAWMDRGAIVAMTGDGVNDAPALREAHVGIAMGRGGTEVTRQVADVVLADDNFASIVAAIHEGRGIFENIRKTLVYLLAGNVAELLVMLVAALVGFPVPLRPLHLLWINLVTDGLPALALVMDPADDDLLNRPPRPTDEPMLASRQWWFIATVGSIEAALALVVFLWVERVHGVDAARGLTFLTLVFSEVFRALAARSTNRTYWEVGPFSNLRLLGIVLASFLMQVAVFYLPLTRGLFGLTRLDSFDLALAIVVALIPVSVIELLKLRK
jgi:P-type Ca2+ transporter type 2C